jgi:hypothetical protein
MSKEMRQMEVMNVPAQNKTTKSIYGKYKYKYDILASKDSEPSEIMLADMKLQQSISLQQQLIKCNSCNKYSSEKLEKTMKR